MIRSRLPSPARVQWHPKHSCCSLAAKTSHSSLQFWGAAIQLLPLHSPPGQLISGLFHAEGGNSAGSHVRRDGGFVLLGEGLFIYWFVALGVLHCFGGILSV